MKSLRIRVPSKTFLIGEYSALSGGPAIVACTSPMFTAEIRSAKSDGNGPFPKGSPGQGLLDKLQGNQDLTWADPHQGRGGFGGSSAQFIAAKFAEQIAQTEVNIPTAGDAFAWRSELLEFSKMDGGGVIPSGYDLIAQITGGIAVIAGETCTAKRVRWPFAEDTFLILRTGLKVNTHEHLNQLKGESFPQLEAQAGEAQSALIKGQARAFYQAVTNFRNICLNSNLTSPESSSILEKFDDLTLAGKCCGAYGADSIVLFLKRKDSEKIMNRLRAIESDLGRSLEVVATADDLGSLESESA